jgi:hypothetical protein
MNGQDWPLNSQRPGWWKNGYISFSNYPLMGPTGEYYCSPKTANLSIGVYNGQNYQREGLTFDKIHLKVGKYRVADNVKCEDTLVWTGFGLLTSDGDVGAGSYKPLESADNYFEITSIDTVNNWVEAKFQVTFVAEPGSIRVNYPDTLRLTNGYIKARQMLSTK